MTTSADAARGVNASGKIVLAFAAFGLLVIFASSFFYRLEHPSLAVRQARRPSGMEQALNGPMREVLALMEKLQENPDDPALQQAMAERFMAMGAFDRAKIFLDKVVKVRPDDPDVQNDLGVVLYNLQDLQGAKAAFERILAKNPADYRARFNMGLLYKYALHEPEKARQALQTVIDAPATDAKTREQARRELEAKPAP